MALSGEGVGRESSRRLTSNGVVPSRSLIRSRSAAVTTPPSSLFSSVSGESLTNQLIELTTFRECQELLRGTTLATVLRCGDAIFASSAGSDDTYMLSKRMVRIEAFISHNWSVPRYKKFLGLCLVYNFKFTVAIAFVLTVLVSIGTASGAFPLIHDRTEPTGRAAFGCKLLFVPIFFGVFFFGRTFFGYFGHRGPTVFLDKVCIHQVDMEVQRRGIRKLGAFLNSSERMVVLYSDVYLQKLWTVYEMASFLTLHPVSDVTILPVFQAVVFSSGLCVCYIYNLSVVVLRMFVDNRFVMYAFTLSATMWFAYVVRMWARDKEAINMRLSNFTVKNCLCFNESDRPVVYHNISALMMASKVVPKDADEEVALSAFDTLVRRDLPSAFVSVHRPCAFTYTQLVMIGSAMDGVKALDQMSSYIAQGCSTQSALAEALFHVLWMTALWPLAWFAIQQMASSFLYLVGWQQKAWLLFSVLLVALPFAALDSAALALTFAAETSEATLATMMVLIVACIVLANMVIQGRCSCRCRRRPPPNHQGSRTNDGTEDFVPGTSAIQHQSSQDAPAVDSVIYGRSSGAAATSSGDTTTLDVELYIGSTVVGSVGRVLMSM